jgi:2-dehydropantoate 2-reductase
MRFVVMGAGGIGGVLGARLHRAGHETVLVARGVHGDALAASGVRLGSPSGWETVAVPAVHDPVELQPHGGEDVVLLTTKSQQTVAALRALVAAGFADSPIVCVQNGVQNERAALRRFGAVYGCCVMFPTTFLEPGVVQEHSAPVPGLLDVGRYPAGSDLVASRVTAAFGDAGFDCRVLGDVMRWKYRKLVLNLGNAVEAVCGPAARGGTIDDLARQEGEACLAAAGIDAASTAEDEDRRGGLVVQLPVGGRPRPGGSSWQSIARGTGSIETDYLNGEIVMLGRLHGVPTPVNALLQRMAGDLARHGRAPGSTSQDEFLARLP